MINVSEKKNLWISIYHPGEIINAVGLAIFLKDYFTVNLLIKKHPYWRGISKDFFANYFNSIYWFPDIGFSKHFFREICKIIKTKFILKRLYVRDGDIFLTLSNKSFIDNIFLSIYKNIFKIKMVTRTECLDTIKNFLGKKKNYKEIWTSKIWNWSIMPFFRLQPIVYLQNIEDRGLYELVYKKGDKVMFDKFLYFKSYDENDLLNDDIYNFLPFIREKAATGDSGAQRNTVVFFGEGRDHYDKYHCDFTNRCLRYLEKFFPSSRLIYKPHPIDFAGFELNNLDLGKFEVYREGGITEIFLLGRINEIKGCFSISSTSLRKALDLGVPSYYFLNLYANYSKEYFELMLKFTHNAPSSAFINSFDLAPASYQVEDGNIKKFNKEINKLDFIKYV